MRNAGSNIILTSFMSLVVLFAGMVMAANGARSFASPQAAVSALVAALRADDKPRLLAILGPDAEDIISSGDEAQDSAARAKFLAAYDAHSDIARRSASTAVLIVGNDEWPLPIPLVKRAGAWRFDSAAGKHEILARRIGNNELSAIQSCLAYVDAQREYASEDRGDGVLDYAQRFMSTPGKHDGLYWETTGNQLQSPLGPAFAAGRAQGYFGGDATQGPSPYHGYYYRILTAQGPDAKGGAYSYLAGGHMIGGFALVAYPANYGVSGITTFIVNQDGGVYQKDLGPDSADIASKMTEFDPGAGWTNT